MLTSSHSPSPSRFSIFSIILSFPSSQQSDRIMWLCRLQYHGASQTRRNRSRKLSKSYPLTHKWILVRKLWTKVIKKVIINRVKEILYKIFPSVVVILNIPWGYKVITINYITLKEVLNAQGICKYIYLLVGMCDYIHNECSGWWWWCWLKTH